MPRGRPECGEGKLRPGISLREFLSGLCAVARNSFIYSLFPLLPPALNPKSYIRQTVAKTNSSKCFTNQATSACLCRLSVTRS